MLKDKTLTYISLFSSAGVGCYGFHTEGFHCIATNELISRRLDVQRANKKCKFDTGYIDGDITKEETKNRIYNEIHRWNRLGNDGVDVIIATPPCQGISVINHKKNEKDINRNSLVVESVEIIQNIMPKFFIMENVMAFQKTLCIDRTGRALPIGDFIRESLGDDYIISGRILNFMNYGSNSSRTRTLMIGVHKKYRNVITPYDLYPSYRPEKTLRDVIGAFPVLEWGEICDADFYHAFRTYSPEMREWIHDLRAGESAFDNADPSKRPHRVINGQIVENIRKNRDKYTRQPWDRFVQCVHTRNDQLAAQNTIHPVEDRVFSIRELMEMMTIPHDFKWLELNLGELNALTESQKRAVYKAHEVNIRQCLGEAVPTEIMRQVAHNIKTSLNGRHLDSADINRLIVQYKLDDEDILYSFVENNPENLDIPTLMRITELCNAKREENAAFYTNKFIVNEIIGNLPSFSKDVVHILEPSVGAGSFLPFLFKKYENVPCVILDVVDIDENSIRILQLLMQKVGVPSNFEIHYHTHDFLTLSFPYRFDLAIGNPPFSKLKSSDKKVVDYLRNNCNKCTSNLSEFFFEKCARISDCVALVLNKTILSTDEFQDTRAMLSKMKIESIIDFGRYGFTGVSIETMCIVVYPNQCPKATTVINMKYNMKKEQRQSYITDVAFPYFIIYRDTMFDEVAQKLKLDAFSVFRDRQITKAITSSQQSDGDLWVIKARNIDDNGEGVTHIQGYDVYLSEAKAKELSAFKYVNNDNIFLTPNMTYNPRVIRNISNTIADGSVAILIPKVPLTLTEEQLRYFSSQEYRRFYAIARNLSTQSINVDKTSVYFYGVLRNDE